jgi:hypothetical protein
VTNTRLGIDALASVLPSVGRGSALVDRGERLLTCKLLLLAQHLLPSVVDRVSRATQPFTDRSVIDPGELHLPQGRRFSGRPIYASLGRHQHSIGQSGRVMPGPNKV